MNIKEIQEQINDLQKSLDLFNASISYDWSNAPVICELNGSRWVLGPECDEELTWDAAVAWCESVGGELPPRDISLQCYMNADIKKEFTAAYYWSSTELAAAVAWYQYFDVGYQSYNVKTYAGYVRAVRRLDI